MAALAGCRADRYVIAGWQHRGRRAHPAAARRMTGSAGETGDHRVIHRRTLVADREAREVAGTVAAVAGGGIKRDVIGRWHLEGRRRHVGKAAVGCVTRGAGCTADDSVIHRVTGVVRAVRMAGAAGRRRAIGQRDMIAGQVGGALEAGGVEVASGAFARRHVGRAISLDGGAQQCGRCTGPAVALLVATRAGGSAHDTVHHRGWSAAARIGEHERGEVRTRVAVLAGAGTEGHVIRRRHLELRRREVGEAAVGCVAQRAAAADAIVPHQVHTEIRRVRMTERAGLRGGYVSAGLYGAVGKRDCGQVTGATIALCRMWRCGPRHHRHAEEVPAGLMAIRARHGRCHGGVIHQRATEAGVLRRDMARLAGCAVRR